jgi:hypothetical protein
MHDQAFEHDPDHHNQRERKGDALPQHRAQRRRKQLGYRFNGVVEHICASLPPGWRCNQAETFAPHWPLRQCARGHWGEPTTSRHRPQV